MGHAEISSLWKSMSYCSLNPPPLRKKLSGSPLSHWKVSYIILGNDILIHLSCNSKDVSIEYGPEKEKAS